MPLLRSSSNCRYPMKLQAEAVQNRTSGIPNSLAAFTPKVMIPSTIMQVIGGTSDEHLSLSNSSLNGPKQFFLVESHSGGTSWVASRSDGGKPSGMVSNRKSGRPLTESGPLDLIKRPWLNSVLTKLRIEN
ncbi:hypothetical protein TorRG33x02_133390 [Trema orientale]|uniref:Uncharacterized protein n=1 Tax=Trema orientale TaxID=63057 RepID=A0A2P5EZH8_TREOI|nr:hypothetical protein TorRG33x02_133390 [Trema orientale]